MDITKESLEKIYKIVKGDIYNKKKDKLFSELYYEKFSILDKAKTLSVFLDNPKLSNLRYMWNYKKNMIMESCKEGINELKDELNISNCMELLSFGEMYTALANGTTKKVEFDEHIYYEIFSGINKILSNDDTLISHRKVKNIIESYIKMIGYNSKNEEIYNNILNSSSYKLAEEIICKYIESIDIQTEIENDNTLLIITECQNVMKSNKISKKLQEKVQEEIDFGKYNEYVTKNKKMDEETSTQCKRDAILYRMKYERIPENLCIYFCNQKDNLLLRIGGIDFIKDYMHKIGIENPVAFEDGMLEAGHAVALGKRGVVFQKTEISYITFHEVTHLKQKEDYENGNVYGYRYSMMKDMILMGQLPYEFIKEGNNPYKVYLQNHNNYLFEIDADTQGKIQMAIFNFNHGVITESQMIENIALIKKEEQERIQGSNNIKINEKIENKFNLFDKIIQENPSIIEDFPILQVEYNNDGKKRQPSEIIQLLDKLFKEGKITEEQRDGINNCIFNLEKICENKMQKDAVEQSRRIITTDEIGKTTIDIQTEQKENAQAIVNKDVKKHELEENKREGVIIDGE